MAFKIKNSKAKFGFKIQSSFTQNYLCFFTLLLLKKTTSTQKFYGYKKEVFLVYTQ